MKKRSLRTTIVIGFLAVIAFMSISVIGLGVFLINKSVYEKTQSDVKRDLKAARTFLQGEIDTIGERFAIISDLDDIDLVKERTGMDYLEVVDRSERSGTKSEIVKKAFKGQETGGLRIIEKEELLSLNNGLYKKIGMDVIFTPKARPMEIKYLDKAMAFEYARPFFDDKGEVEKVMFGGKVINRNYDFVDKVRDLVFEDDMYAGKPLGTVTIFQDDIRISTNVRDKDGQRAIGTRVSKAVYDNVVEEGKRWLDRAFVVTDWYITGYEPIKDVSGKIIGILYVGILEQPFNDMIRNALMAFIALIVLAVIFGIILSLVLSDIIARPITSLMNGTGKFSSGELDHRVKPKTAVIELNRLAASFNLMARKLDRSYKELKVSHDQLIVSNKRYLDLISFVSHELKGILASTILNAYSVRDGFLGMVNFKQQKALDSITRNLDYLESTVKNFLGLSRIEKDELVVSKSRISLKEDIVDMAVDTFLKQIQEKDIELIEEVDPELEVSADRTLLLIAVNNLLNNAVKYGKRSGKIKIKSTEKEDRVEISVYNQGTPISKEQVKKLFKRFSRLDVPEHKREKGTGLGLFITKEIIERHGGEIRVEPDNEGNSFIFYLRS